MAKVNCEICGDLFEWTDAREIMALAMVIAVRNETKRRFLCDICFDSEFSLQEFLDPNGDMIDEDALARLEEIGRRFMPKTEES